MKRILFFIESLTGGGAERVLTDIVSNLDKNKFDVTVVSVVDVGVYIEDVKRHCKYFSILDNPSNCNNWFKRLLYKINYKVLYSLPASWIYKLFLKNEYDIEVGFVEGFATKIISKSNNKKSKKIAWVHVDPINWDYADQYFRNIEEQKSCYKQFDQIVCVSKSVKHSFEQKVLKNDQLAVIYNPVDSETITFKSDEKCNIRRPDKMLVGTIGRLTAQKGYDRLLKITKKLKSQGLDFEVWILGEGQERIKLEKFIEDNSLDGTVKILGFHKNPYKYIKQCDLFVCSSRAEGFSLAIAESMVLELPVISTDCSGPNELLNYGEYGLLVNNDDDSLYNGLKKLLTEKSILMDYKKKSSERREIFNIKTTIKEIEKLFDQEVIS